MPQHDYDIANQAGAAFRADLNNVLAAIASLNSGLNAPTVTFSGMFWLDTGTSIDSNGPWLRQRNSSNTAWERVLQVDVGLIDAIQAQTYTAFTSAGAAPTYTLTPVPAITAYAAGQRWRVKFHATGTTGSNTLNVNGLGAKNIKQYDSTGGKVAGVVAANQLADLEYDGTDLVILDPLPPVDRQIQPITASVATNALTLTLNPTTLDFRSATLGSGTVNTRTVGSATSLVISSGSTLGTTNGVAARIALLAIDNAGTVELAAVNLAGGNNLDETTLISTTAEGGAGGADSASTIYSTTARTNVPFRVVGFIDITQAAAGTWATAPSVIQGVGAGEVMKSSINLGASVNSTSGSAFDFTAIPSWATRLTFTFQGVSHNQTSGSNDIYMQLGDSGGFENTGYVSWNSVAVYPTDRFMLVRDQGGAYLNTGSLVLDKTSATSWTLRGFLCVQGVNTFVEFTGYKTLSATLDSVRIGLAANSGSLGTFDAGTIGFSWE